MRWRTYKFALIAAIPLILAAMSITPAAHASAAPTETLVTWEGRSSAPTPGDITDFFVTVSASSCPVGKVTLFWNGTAQDPPKPLQSPCASDGASPPTFTARTSNWHLDLRDTTTGRPRPNDVRARYAPDDQNAFLGSVNDLGIGVPSLTANPEPSQDGQIVIYTFTLWVSSPPGASPPAGHVRFFDDQGHDSSPANPQLTQAPGDNTHFNATWQRSQSTGRTRTTAHFSPDTDPYLAADTFRDHNVNPPPAAPGDTTPSTSKSTATTKGTVPKGKSPTTAALTPIAGATSSTTPTGSTTPSPESTNVTFGEFQSPPPTSGNASALADNKKKNNGPPLAVVVMTLGALGILGGIGAVRRYRRPSDWL